MKSNNDAITKGLKGVMDGVEIHQWKLGRNGINKDVRIGNTTYKDIEDENSF